MVFFPGNPSYRMEAGPKAEMVLLISLLLYAVGGMGFRVRLQHLLGNFDVVPAELRRLL